MHLYRLISPPKDIIMPQGPNPVFIVDVAVFMVYDFDCIPLAASRGWLPYRESYSPSVLPA